MEDDLEPPFVIAVQGSSESGKTTLIKSLVHHFTKQKVTTVRGTITLRTNKNQRITFMECPTNMQAMVDMAKIVDLGLLLIDASIGFEMETFEFLCLLHNHGMPNVMGILTHLDYYKLNKHLRKTKKRMKKRFWKEVHDGAKLFYFSGLSSDGHYPKTEVNNLARFITVQKLKPLTWRTQHAYMVTDRFDVVETPNKADTNTVSFYGYVRGTYLDKHNRLHINGLGDYDISSISKVEDPCPIEVKRSAKEKSLEHEREKQLGVKSKKSMRTLKDRDKVLYAPFSNIGALNFEKSTGYITIPDSQVIYTRVANDDEDEEEGEGGPGVAGLGNAKVQGLGERDAKGKSRDGVPEGNEGQKMMWHLQDMQDQIDAENIEAPQLLPGIDLVTDLEERKKNRRLYKPELDKLVAGADEMADPTQAFRDHESKAK